MEIRLFPEEQLVDDFKGSQMQQLHHLAFGEDTHRKQDPAQWHLALVALILQGRSELCLVDFAVVQEKLTEILLGIGGSRPNDGTPLKEDLFRDALATDTQNT